MSRTCREAFDLIESTRCFEDSRAQLYDQYPHKFALVFNSQIVEMHETYQDAIEEGFRRFGGTGFLIKKIEPPREPIDLCLELR